MRSPSAWLAASSCLLVVAGCGSSSSRSRPAPKIPAAVAARLSADADAVAASPGCAAHDAAARLQADAIASISRVPSRYQESLMSAANEIASRAPACPPPKDHPKHEEHPPKHKRHGDHGHD